MSKELVNVKFGLAMVLLGLLFGIGLGVTFGLNEDLYQGHIAAGIAAHVVSYETDVKATLAKVQLGEADAAIVYHSDVISAGELVHGVQIPASVNQRLGYPLVRLTSDPTTVELMAYILSDQGRKRLRDNGFLTP